MANSEYNHKEMVMLYDPSKEHRCNLPLLGMVGGNEIRHRTIMECEECAQRWWAHVNSTNYMDNVWHKLRWYHFVLRGKIG